MKIKQESKNFFRPTRFSLDCSQMTNQYINNKSDRKTRKFNTGKNSILIIKIVNLDRTFLRNAPKGPKKARRRRKIFLTFF
jgi:hypothetical protein